MSDWKAPGRRRKMRALLGGSAADSLRYAVNVDYYGMKQFVETAQEAMTDFKDRPKVIVTEAGDGRLSFFDSKTGTQIEAAAIAREKEKFDLFNARGERVFFSGTSPVFPLNAPGTPPPKEQNPPPESILEFLKRTAGDAFQNMNLEEARKYQEKINALRGLMNQQLERDLQAGGLQNLTGEPGLKNYYVDETASFPAQTYNDIVRSQTPAFKPTPAQTQFMRRRTNRRLEEQYREEQALGLGPESEPVPPGQTRYSQWGCVFVVRWENASGWMVISGPEADRKYAMLGENNPPNWNDVIRLVTQDWTALTGRDRPRTSGPSGPEYESARSTSQRLQTGPKTGARVYSRDD